MKLGITKEIFESYELRSIPKKDIDFDKYYLIFEKLEPVSRLDLSNRD